MTYRSKLIDASTSEPDERIPANMIAIVAVLFLVEREPNHWPVETGPTARDARKAYAEQLTPWKPALLHAVDLYMRAPAMQVEVVATALYVARELERAGRHASGREVFDGVLAWKIRRRSAILPEEVGEAVRNPSALGWVDLAMSHDLPMPASAEI